MEERVLNINLIYIYPKTLEINNEINLFRIVDKNVKESLVFYCIKGNNKYKVYITNTMTGENINFANYNDEQDLYILINNIKSKEADIKILKDLELIEKYILKIIKN